MYLLWKIAIYKKYSWIESLSVAPPAQFHSTLPNYGKVSGGPSMPFPKGFLKPLIPINPSKAQGTPDNLRFLLLPPLTRSTGASTPHTHPLGANERSLHSVPQPAASMLPVIRKNIFFVSRETEFCSRVNKASMLSLVGISTFAVFISVIFWCQVDKLNRRDFLQCRSKIGLNQKCPFSNDKKWDFKRLNLKTDSKNLAKHTPKWWTIHLVHAFHISGKYQANFAYFQSFWSCFSPARTKFKKLLANFCWWVYVSEERKKLVAVLKKSTPIFSSSETSR